MASKSVVVRSFNLDGDARCVDLYRRPDGSFGFEEYRREPEDGRGWFVIGNHGSRVFPTEASALAEAKRTVAWLAAVADVP